MTWPSFRFASITTGLNWFKWNRVSKCLINRFNKLIPNDISRANQHGGIKRMIQECQTKCIFITIIKTINKSDVVSISLFVIIQQQGKIDHTVIAIAKRLSNIDTANNTRIITQHQIKHVNITSGRLNKLGKTKIITKL